MSSFKNYILWIFFQAIFVANEYSLYSEIVVFAVKLQLFCDSSFVLYHSSVLQVFKTSTSAFATAILHGGMRKLLHFGRLSVTINVAMVILHGAAV